jgi:hypothetical protein
MIYGSLLITTQSRTINSSTLTIHKEILFFSPIAHSILHTKHELRFAIN